MIPFLGLFFVTKKPAVFTFLPLDLIITMRSWLREEIHVIKEWDLIKKYMSNPKFDALCRVSAHTVLLLLYSLVLGAGTTMLTAFLWSLLPFQNFSYVSGGRNWSWLLWLIKYTLAVTSIIIYPLMVP